MKKFLKTTIVLWFVLSAVIFCTCEEEDPPNYDMTGTYKFEKSGGECTWVFRADKSYQVSGYGINETKTGTWSTSGNDVTLSYSSGSGSISVSGSEVFTVQESGDRLTLTLKDGSVSNLLVSLGLAAKSVTLTNTNKVTLYSVTANAFPHTTQLTLTFSQTITWLSADDIALSGVSGVTKGTLSRPESSYILPISGFSEGGSLSVSVSKSGYAISGSPKTVTIYYFSVSDSVSVEMVQITAGTFTMGSPTSEAYRDSNETQHSVTLSGFYMSKYQVTQEQYYAVMGTNPSNFHGGSGREPATGENQGKRPVEQVTWYDAVEFCNKLSVKEGRQEVYTISGRTPATGYPIENATVTADFSKNGYRLPTEAEWEYACRAGTTTAYNTGDTISDNTGWYDSNSGNKTHEVGKKPVNAWGLYDMHGNVKEWCWDWYAGNYYSSIPANDPTGPESGAYRVVRGGGWGNDFARDLRSAYRVNGNPYNGSYDIGFRLVRP